MDRSYVAENAVERARLKAIVAMFAWPGAEDENIAPATSGVARWVAILWLPTAAGDSGSHRAMQKPP